MSFPNLYQYLTIVFLVSMVMDMYNRGYYFVYLSLDIGQIMHGQIWRLFTFIFYPLSSSYSILLSLLLVYVYYSITKTLTMMWRPFKFNLYMFIGYISLIIGGFISYFIFKIAFPPIVPFYQMFSVIMAFALSFPDAMFYLYFFVPIKAKYFAYIELAFFAISFITAIVPERIAIICSAVNVFIFFVLWKNKI